MGVSGAGCDATNVKDNPLVSVITSLSREHWQRLGPTVADIAKEKAGVIKLNCPLVIGQLPNSAKEVVMAKAQELAAPVTVVEPAKEIQVRANNDITYSQVRWAKFATSNILCPCWEMYS